MGGSWGGGGACGLISCEWLCDGEESEGNEWNAGAWDWGRQLRTEAGRQLVGSAGGTCHFGHGIQICMLRT